MRRFVRALFPQRCLICRKRVAEGPSVCGSCWVRMRFIERPWCSVSGVPFGFEYGEGVMDTRVLWDRPPWEAARGAVAFDDVSRHIVHRLKYHDQHDAGLFMARAMARCGRDLLSSADLLIPVPLHPFKLWQRRYNQSQILVRHLSAFSGIPFSYDVLHRIRPTDSQIGLSALERKKNVRQAFAIPPLKRSCLQGKKILLIDDVMTTGSTLRACAEALMQGEPQTLFVLVFAMTLAQE